MDTSFLLLEDGTVFTAVGFGLPAPLLGREAPMAEVVFNTSMCGYQEIVTDPSYHGQMVVMTYPHIGNYGCEASFEEHLDLPNPISCTALIVHSVYTGPLPPKRVSLHDYLLTHKVVGLSGVDTRALTIHIRNKGAQKAIIFRTEGKSLSRSEHEHALSLVRDYPSVSEIDLIEGVSTKQVIKDPWEGAPKEASLRFAVVDFGIKRSIITELYRRGVAVTLFPPTVDSYDILHSGCNAIARRCLDDQAGHWGRAACLWNLPRSSVDHLGTGGNHKENEIWAPRGESSGSGYPKWHMLRHQPEP
jgi:carbamoyl-phosphate synthase small subunit